MAVETNDEKKEVVNSSNDISQNNTDAEKSNIWSGEFNENNETDNATLFDGSVNIEEVVKKIKDATKADNQILNQFEENEKQNRQLKNIILIVVGVFAAVQMLIMAMIILIVVVSLVVGNSKLWFIHKIDTVVCNSLFSFLKYYISATIAELLGMLYVIVKNVFNNNIIKMYRESHNKKNKNKDKEQDKQEDN